MREGRLPNIRRLVEEGASGVLRSTLEPITPCAWASMVTGKNPGKTGVFDFAQVVRGTYDVKFPNRTNVAGPSLWRQAERHGLKTVIVNVPMGYPADRLARGRYVAGMGAPSPQDGEVFWPPGLRAEVEGALGEPYRMMEFEEGRRSKDGHAVLRRSLLSYTDFQRRLSHHLLEEHDPDLFFIVFPSPDQAGHYFWMHHDPRHPLHTPALAAEHGEALLEVHEAVDRAVGEIVGRHAGPDTSVWLLSDHGMGPFHRAPDFVRFLEAEGYLRLRIPAARAERMIWLMPLLGRLSAARHNLFQWLKRTLPRGLKEALNRRFSRQKEAYKEGMTVLSVYDWERTKVYVTDPKNLGELHVNLKGREPRGIVDPADYEPLRTEIKELFEGAVLADGTRLVERVWRREEVYSGPYLEEAPDLLVEWNLNGMGHLDPAEEEVPPRYRPLLRRFDVTPSWSDVALPFNGFHRMEGIWAASGPGIRPGLRGVDAHIWDPFMSILAWLGVPVPSDADSAPLDIWEDGSGPEVRREEVASTLEERAYSPEEEEAVRERLRDMGYLS